MKTLILLAVCALALPVMARDLYVNADSGADSASGLSAKAPFKTIHHAIAAAKPGDAIHLAKLDHPYHESIEFINRSGEPGRPITLDGHGATITGADLLDPAEWKSLGGGLHRSEALYKHRSIYSADVGGAAIARYFFVFDGKIQHMGRTSKGPKLPLKKPADLKPGEWTFVKAEKAFYVKIDPGQTLADARIEAPMRSSGIMIYGGDCEHLAVQNLTVTHVYNDGCNIHAKTRDIRLENIKAIECGDDGFSAHDDCRVDVKNFTAIGNSTGICNAGQSVCTFENIHLEGNLGFGFYLINTAQATVHNGVIRSTAGRPFYLGGGRDKRPCHAILDHVVLESLHPGQNLRIQPNGILDATHLTCRGMDWIIQGKVTLHDSSIGGDPAPHVQFFPGSKWIADYNRYDVKYFRIDKTFYPPAHFDAFKTATEGDAHSTWAAATPKR